MTPVWRHSSKTGHDMKKYIFSKCSSNRAEQLLPRSTLLKIMFEVTKHEIKSKNHWKMAKWRLYDVIRQKRDMIWKRKLFQNVPLIMLSNFYHDQHCLKIKLSWRNRRLSQKITEKRQNDGCMTSYVKNGTWYEKENFFKMFLWSYWTTFTIINIA